MTKQVTFKPIDIKFLAEGSPESRELKEPTSPLKTTTVPAITGSKDGDIQSGETGLTTSVNLKAEGKDDDDAQDASQTTDETKAKPTTEKAKDQSNGKPKVLIVEDTIELGEVIQATLERMELDVEMVTHGSRGIEKLKENKPNVVLLDIGLPDMIGWKILDTLKEIYEKPDAGDKPTVIIITAYGDPANRLVAKLQGIHDYLIKPFTPDQVEKVVRGALSSTS